MPSPLIDRLTDDLGYPRVTAKTLDTVLHAADNTVLFFTADPANTPEANDVAVVHVRGVSSRSRPLFVEWHKHRGLWRYFRKFEAPRRPLPVRFGVWCAIWAHAALQLPRLLLR